MFDELGAAPEHRVKPAVHHAHLHLMHLLGCDPPGVHAGFRHITHDDDLGTDAANLEEVRAGKVDRHRVLKRYLHADGHPVPVEVYAASVHSADGEPYCVVAHVLPA